MLPEPWGPPRVKSDCLAVGRPTVEPAGVLSDEARRAAGRGNDVDAVIRIVGCGTGEGEPFAVGREAVTAGAVGQVADVEELRSSAGDGNCVDAAVPRENEGLAVARPVWRHETARLGQQDGGAACVVGDVDGLQSAVEDEFRWCGGRSELLEFHVGEGDLLSDGRVVRGETDADIERPVEMELDGGADLVKRLAVVGDEHGEDVAAFFEANAPGADRC